ncbi:hypothetical protein Tco_0737640 [Tanacetum coccineum]
MSRSIARTLRSSGVNTSSIPSRSNQPWLFEFLWFRCDSWDSEHTQYHNLFLACRLVLTFDDHMSRRMSPRVLCSDSWCSSHVVELQSETVLSKKTVVAIASAPKNKWNLASLALFEQPQQEFGSSFGQPQFYSGVRAVDVSCLIPSFANVRFNENSQGVSLWTHRNSHEAKGSTSCLSTAMIEKDQRLINWEPLLRTMGIGIDCKFLCGMWWKEVGVLENLKVALGNEGFSAYLMLRYRVVCGLWIAFDSVEAKEKFLFITGVVRGKTHWVSSESLEIPGWTPDLMINEEESESGR